MLHVLHALLVCGCDTHLAFAKPTASNSSSPYYCFCFWFPYHWYALPLTAYSFQNIHAHVEPNVACMHTHAHTQGDMLGLPEGARVEMYTVRIPPPAAPAHSHAWHAAHVLRADKQRLHVLCTSDDAREYPEGYPVSLQYLRKATGAAPLIGPQKALVAHDQAWGIPPVTA